jgi:inositol phosphorylceramide mannosyltransferase catalytic subunit
MEPPRLIHRIWVGPPMPEHLKAFGERWADLHPGWTVRLWGDDELGWLTNRPLFDRAEQLVPADAVGQFRADLARYEILATYGGVYVDCDLEPLRPIDSLHVHEAWAGWEVEGRFVGNTILGGNPGAPFWQACVDRLPQSVHTNRGRRPNRMSGPHFVTRVAADLRLHVYPQTFFYPYAHDQLDRAGRSYGDAYAAHHWHHQRDLRSKPL